MLGTVYPGAVYFGEGKRITPHDSESPQFIVSTSAVGTDSSVTSAGIDTTGATILILGVAHGQGATMVISDSKGNTWQQLSTSSVTGSVACTIFFARNPIVGTAHTFTNTGTANFSTIYPMAFRGVERYSPFDVENGNTSSGVTTVQTGSVLPNKKNEVIVTLLGINGAGLPTSIDGGFTKTDSQEFGAGNNYGGSIAYLIQTNPVSANPTWTRTNVNAMATRIATFKPELMDDTRWQINTPLPVYEKEEVVAY